MQRIANEMNFSETTFISSEQPRNGGFDVRIFTPKTELPFAGHPTLGTAFIIQREVLGKPVDEIALNLKVGQIPVTFSYSGSEADILWMKQLQPTFNQTFEAENIAQLLNLNPNQVDDRFPVQVVSTGVPTTVVPLKNLDSVKQAEIHKARYFEFIKDLQAKTVLVFCPETYKKENGLNVRFFADYYGIPEDPATGSANGCLAAYLVKHRYFEDTSVNVRVEQGYEIGRPSLLLLKGNMTDDRINVYVGGKTILVGKGKLV